MTLRLTTLTFVTAILTGCVTTPPAMKPPAFDVAEIRAAESALADALEAADTSTWVDHYTADAIYVAPGEPAVEGREALLEMARSMKPLSSVSITPLRTEGGGNLAYMYGHASWVYRETTYHVRLVLIWRKEADGRWRVAQEIQNALPSTGSNR